MIKSTLRRSLAGIIRDNVSEGEREREQKKSPRGGGGGGNCSLLLVVFELANHVVAGEICMYSTPCRCQTRLAGSLILVRR